MRLDLLPRVSGDPNALGAGIAARLRDRAGFVIDAILDPVANTGALVTWKAARVLDDRAEPDAAAVVARRVAHRCAVTC